jgi:ribose 5-phosphate isomerase B
MKRFDIITETDARVLTSGETVILAQAGHITPLAQDTLRERRVTIVREGQLSQDDATLVPRAEIRSVALASDRAGDALCDAMAAFLRSRGLAVQDVRTGSSQSLDYVDASTAVGELVARGDVDAGIVIDAAGAGSAVAANKIAGVRAVMATSEALARYSREHTGANVLTLGATLISETEARAIVSTWLTTATREPEYIRRLAKIRDLEQRGRRP